MATCLTITNLYMSFGIFFLSKKQSDEVYPPSDEPKSPTVAEGEKPQPMPLCYYNLLAGRAQRTTGTSSSSPEQAPAAGMPRGQKIKSQFSSTPFYKSKCSINFICIMNFLLPINTQLRCPMRRAKCQHANT